MNVATPMSPWALVVRLILVAIGLRRRWLERRIGTRFDRTLSEELDRLLTLEELLL